MGTVVTLDEALQVIASASFHEDKRVIPVVRADAGDDIVGYLVEDDWAYASDEWTWTYEDGVRGRESVDEVSRLFDPCEHFATAEHVRYNMAESIDALESGKAVTFAYAVVSDEDASEDEGDDDLAGWILVALID